MSKTRTILVTGATGRQGGAVVRGLQGSDFEILALTRNASAPGALKLAQSSANIKLLEGDLDNVTAVFEKAKMLTSNPIWGVYSVQVKAKAEAMEESVEEKQGKSLIDAALANNVEFFVYNSVDRGGEKSSITPTFVPHWATKYNIEKHLEQKVGPESSMKYTILRPTGHMEVLTNDFQGKVFASGWKAEIPDDKPFHMIAAHDIGWFGAHAFKNPEDYAGRAISLAGSKLTFSQASAVFKQKFGKEMPTTFGIVSHVILGMLKEYGIMFKWLRKEGNAADIDELKKTHPDLMDFGTWLEKESQFRKSA